MKVSNSNDQSSMRVLIADFDFFSTIGGGQVLYQRIVERNPNIDFFYLSRGPDLEACSKLPLNAHPLRYLSDVGMNKLRGKHGVRFTLDGLGRANWVVRDLCETALRIAASVRGVRFDLVDVPSFRPIAHLIQPALVQFGSGADRIALSLVGWLSVGLLNGWAVEVGRTQIEALEHLEQLSFDASDIRYSISRSHIKENAHHSALPIALIDMHDIIEQYGQPLSWPKAAAAQPVHIWYVGRLDRNKGPDIFLELVAGIPDELIASVNIVGPDAPCADGVNWSDQIAEIAISLGLEYTYHGAMPTDEIVRCAYGGRSIIVIPSRTDSFNLVVAEAALRGCPVLASRRIGAWDFICEHHPNFPIATFDPDDLQAARKTLVYLCEDYDHVRMQLVESLVRNPWREYREGFMNSIYLDRQQTVCSAKHAGIAEIKRLAKQQSWGPISAVRSLFGSLTN